MAISTKVALQFALFWLISNILRLNIEQINCFALLLNIICNMSYRTPPPPPPFCNISKFAKIGYVLMSISNKVTL